MVCSPSPDLEGQPARLYDSESLAIQTLTILNCKTIPQTSFRKKNPIRILLKSRKTLSKTPIHCAG